MLSVKDLLSYVTPEIVIDIMEENGSKLYDRTTDRASNQKCYWFQTICHGGDSHKLCYFSESKDFYCYTSCGRMPFFNFISKIKGFKESEFSKTVKYVADKVGKGFTENRVGFMDRNPSKESRQEISDMDTLFESKNRGQKEKVEIKKFYDDKILNFFDKNTFYSGWIDEGISIESMEKFNIRWYEYQKHIIIPHYNIDGKLVGIRRRSLKPEDKDNKYMPEYIQGIMYDHPLGLNLYGLYENKAYIKTSGRAIIVEGEKSVLKSDTYFGDKSITVATCGFNISEWQIRALDKLNVNSVILAFDKDFDVTLENEYRKDEKLWREYNNYINRLKVLGERLAAIFNTSIIIDREGLLQPKDSPFDQGEKVFERLLSKSGKVISSLGL